MSNLGLKSGALVAAALVGAFAIAAPAQAKPKFYPKYYGYHHHHHGYGAPLAAGILGAVALGAVAAAAASEPSCQIEERERIDRFGNVYVRPVRVCD